MSVIGADIYRSTCCRCGSRANGRVCFLNYKDEVVDNLFCFQHKDEVVTRTMKTMAEMHNNAPKQNLAFNQIWGYNGNPGSFKMPTIEEIESVVQSGVLDRSRA